MGKPPFTSSFIGKLALQVQRYAANHDASDIDAVVDHLRSTHEGYRRLKVATFRKNVVKAMEGLKAEISAQGNNHANLKLQAYEDEYRKAQHVHAVGPSAECRGQSQAPGLTDGDTGYESDSSSEALASLADDEDAFAGQGVPGVESALQAEQALKGSKHTCAANKVDTGTVGLEKGGLRMDRQRARAGNDVSGGLSKASAMQNADLEGFTDPLSGRTLVAGTKLNSTLLGLYNSSPRDVASTTVAAAAQPDGLTAQLAHLAQAVEPPATDAQAHQAELPPAEAVLALPGASGRSGRKADVELDVAAARSKRQKVSSRNGGAPAKGPGGGVRVGSRGSAVSTPQPLRYADLGGIEAVLQLIRELVEYPIKHPEVYQWLGVEPPRGVLLHGPPGCGKTALANAIANECGVPFLKISAPEIVSGMSGESEAKLRGLFQEALAVAPCIVFIDEIDAIMPKREAAQREMERRIVAQMLTCMDELAVGHFAGQTDGTREEDASADPTVVPKPRHVVVLGATNRPDSLDAALRRAGRFDREIPLGVPSEAARAQILSVLSSTLRLSGDFDFQLIAKRTPGFVGADLQALTKEAAAIAVRRVFRKLEGDASSASLATPASPNACRPANAPCLPTDHGHAVVARHSQPFHNTTGHTSNAYNSSSTNGLLAQPSMLAIGTSTLAGAPVHEATVVPAAGAWQVGNGVLTAEQLSSCAITMSDFEEAIKHVQPSVRREGFTTTPDVTWDDVGSLEEVREELSYAISLPIAHPHRYEALGVPLGQGVLLFGPPGCGKTLVAKAVANDSGANFISIKGPELLNKYVGESERAVRQLFSRARSAAPCVLFFDEMDALAPRRGSDVNQSTERVVNQLLTEMDGMESRAGVYLVAATNRPDMIDPALLRPGRLDKILYIPLPPPEGRVSILRALTRSTPLAADVDLHAIGSSRACDGFSGADLAALVREAAVAALKATLTAGAAAADASELRVGAQHFAAALAKVSPSVSKADQRIYDALRHKLRASRAHLKPQVVTGATPGEADQQLADGRPNSHSTASRGAVQDMEDVCTADPAPMSEVKDGA